MSSNPYNRPASETAFFHCSLAMKDVMKISKPLVVLDLETTGTWIEKDRIVEIAMIKVLPDGTREVYHRRVNPGMPIPAIVSALIGITNEDVKEEPFFRDIAAEVTAFIGEANLGGFNIERFDLPLLEREMFEAGIKFEWQKHGIYDSQKVYHLNEKRDLTAAYRFYCQKDLENAHTALADTQATLEILTAQVAKYGNGREELEALADFNYRTLAEFYDSERKFRWWNGELYPMFGKHAKRLSLQEIARKDPEYLNWIIAKDFSDSVKELAENALRGQFPPCPAPEVPKD